MRKSSRSLEAEFRLLNLSNKAIYHARAIQSLIVPNGERLRHIKIAVDALMKIDQQIRTSRSSEATHKGAT